MGKVKEDIDICGDMHMKPSAQIKKKTTFLLTFCWLYNWGEKTTKI
jgi:hypothetical protein